MIYIFMSLYWIYMGMATCIRLVTSPVESVGVRGKPLMAFGLEQEPEWFKKNKYNKELRFNTAFISFTNGRSGTIHAFPNSIGFS